MKTSKNMDNLEIAELLRNVAGALKLGNYSSNKFRIVAYERAADAIEHLSSEAKDLWDERSLQEVSGIGESIAKYLGEIFEKGRSEHFDGILEKLPPAMFELMKVPGIGAKTAFKLTKELGITKEKGALTSLKKAIKEGRVQKIEGFGEQSEDSIEKSIQEVKGRKNKRHILPYAETVSAEIIAWMKKETAVLLIEPLGSLRRKVSTIGDIDLAASTNNPVEVIEHFIKYPNKKRILEKGEKTASIVLPGDIQVDLMVAVPSSFGSLLQHFTGSKHHNIALREYANKRGLTLSEYGIKNKKDGSKLKTFKTEEDLYKHLDMKWVPPELREDRGEIEAAQENKLPKLLEMKDIKGDLHIHSDFDIETSHDIGASSMKSLIKKADGLGYEYIAFTEHNPSKGGHSEKQTNELLKAKRETIDKLNLELQKKDSGVKKVFNSLEIDILPDGKLPVNEKGLELLDFALVSIHSSFRQSKADMTKRVLSALTFHPKVKIFAHPTARKLTKREGIELDWMKIFEVCKKEGKFLEINAEPMRLDLPDFLIKDALDVNVKFTLGTDTHHIDHMDKMKYGVANARRGWAAKRNVINTLSLEEVSRLLL